MTMTWCWLSAAVWLWGRPRLSARPTAGRGAQRRGRHDRSELVPASRGRRNRAMSARLARTVTVGATVLGCLAAFGLGTGAVIACVLGPSAFLFIRRLQLRARPDFGPVELARIPLVLDLVAVALASGQPLDAALLAAAANGRPLLAGKLRQVAGLLRLGAEPELAWHGLCYDPRLGPIAVPAIRSAGSGIRLAASFTDLAIDLRARARSTAEAR